MTWHPVLGTPDPSEAWISDDKLDAIRTEEQADEEFRHMLDRRRRFESDLERRSDLTPEEVAALWEQADEETE